MKKQLLSIFSVLTLGLTVALNTYGQDLITMNLQGQSADVSGTTIQETSLGADVVLNIEVRNISNISKDWVITRRVISQTATWQNEVCWGGTGQAGQCYPAYPATTWTTPDMATIAAGNSGTMTLYIKPYNNTGFGDYMYYVSQDGTTYEDSVRVQVSNTASVKTTTVNATLTLAPNPATNFINITASEVEKGTLKVVDVLGNVILNESFNSSKYLNTENFRNGVYFIVIEGNGINTINRKFVVRH